MMKILPKIILLFLLLETPLLNAQEFINSKVKGTVTTADSILDLSGVLVFLLSAKDSSLVQSTFCDSRGNYEFDKVSTAKNYLLVAEKTGYVKTTIGPLTLNTNQPYYLAKEISLAKDIKQLKEVVVTPRTLLIEKKGGKTILHISNNILSAGNNALEILSRSPGIQVDNSENISMKGRQGVVIAIDGKLTYLQNADLAEYLKSISGDAIEQIELITNPSSKYDAAGGAGLINIKLIKGKNIGTNASLTLGTGYGNFYKANINTLINHRNKTFNFFGGYNYSDNKSLQNNFIDKNTTFNKTTTRFKINNDDIKIRKNHQFRVGTDYFISKNQTLGFLLNGISNGQVSAEDNISDVLNFNVVDSTLNTFSDETRKVNNFNYNLNYSINFKKNHLFTLDFDHLNYLRNSSEILTTDYLNSSRSVYRNSLLLRNTSPSHIKIYTANTNYSFTFKDNTTLSTGVKTSFQLTNNERMFEQYLSNNWRADRSRSNTFNYEENILAAYLNLNKKIKKIEIEAGLRVENTNAKSSDMFMVLPNNNYTNVFPNLRVSNQLSDNHQIQVSYGRRITRPFYEDLNPFIYFLDQYTFSEGNPNLKPSFSNVYELAYTFKNDYQASFQYTFEKDFAYAFLIQNDTTKITRQTKKNLNSQSAFTVEVNAPFSITKGWDVNANIQFSHYTFRDASPIENLNNSSPDAIFNISQNLAFNKTWSATLVSYYDTSTSFGIFRFKPQYYFDAGLAKTFLNKAASLRLSFTDIFDTNRDRFSTQYQNLDISAKYKNETRVVRLNFNYRFGGNADKKRRNNFDEESRRIRN